MRYRHDYVEVKFSLDNH